MKHLLKKYPEIKSYSIKWSCEFEQELKSKKTTKFASQILPTLKFFNRLIPRKACFGGKKELYEVKWRESDFLNESCFWLDINSSYTYILGNFK